MKWSPPLDRLWGGLWNMALFAIGHRGPTGDDWTWETPKGAGRAPLGGPLLPLSVALILGMLFGHGDRLARPRRAHHPWPSSNHPRHQPRGGPTRGPPW
jgi:hypothetical protein